MRKLFLSFGLLLSALAFFAFAPAQADTTTVAKEEINWLTWEEAMEAMDNNPKKMFIDVYTDWCGWCKRMDASTFTDPAVVEYMNENFYAVKFNAESKKEQTYKGRTLRFDEKTGRRGAHQLAVVLLGGRLGYPSFAYLDEAQESIMVSPGFKQADVLLDEMKKVVGKQ